MDKIKVKHIYQAVGLVFAIMTCVFAFTIYFEAAPGYAAAGVYFMIICAAAMTLGLSITTFVVASRTDR
jgi:hypothetical protein